MKSQRSTAKRYCGAVEITITYTGARDAEGRYPYQCRLKWNKVCKVDVTVLAPASGFGAGVAYDSSEAYDRTAHAAMSFADDENKDLTGADLGPDGWVITRKPTVAKSQWLKGGSP